MTHVCAGSVCAGVLHGICAHMLACTCAFSCMCMCVCERVCLCECVSGCACTLVTGLRNSRRPAGQGTGVQGWGALKCTALCAPSSHCPPTGAAPSPSVLGFWARYPRPAPEGGQQRQSRPGMSPRAWITHPRAGGLQAKPQQLPRPPFLHLQNGDNQSTTLTGRP